MKHFRSFLFLTFITAALLFQPISVTHAQEPTQNQKATQDVQTDETEPQPTLQPKEKPEGGIDLTVSPVFINLLTDPGKKVSSQIKIKNNSNQTEYLAIKLAKFEASTDGSMPKLMKLDPNDEFLKWISFSESQFTLASNQTKTITVTVTPAKTAGLGYYYGVIFQRIAEKDPAVGESIVAGAPAVSILLEVKSPNAKREIQLVDFTTDKLFYEYLPTTFKVKVSNTGNIHIVPGGNIFIDSLKTKEIAILPFNAPRGNILPDSERTYEVIWNDAMIVTTREDKDGKTSYKTSWDFAKADKFRIGKYTAHVLMVYDNGERDVPLEATVSFWVIPWKILAGLAIVTIFVVIGVRSTLSSWLRKLKSSKK